MVDSANDVLERAAKKGLMKGTKRGKKDSKIPSQPIPKDKQQLDEIPKRLDNVSIDVTDEREPKTESEDEQRKLGKNKSMKPFQF